MFIQNRYVFTTYVDPVKSQTLCSRVHVTLLCACYVLVCLYFSNFCFASNRLFLILTSSVTPHHTRPSQHPHFDSFSRSFFTARVSAPYYVIYHNCIGMSACVRACCIYVCLHTYTCMECSSERLACVYAYKRACTLAGSFTARS